MSVEKKEYWFFHMKNTFEIAGTDMLTIWYENSSVPYIFPSTETWKTPFDVGCFESDKTKGTGLRQNRTRGPRS